MEFRQVPNGADPFDHRGAENLIRLLGQPRTYGLASALADEVVQAVQHALGLAGRPGAAAGAGGGGGGGGAWTCVSRLLCCSLDDGAPRTKWTALVTSER